MFPDLLLVVHRRRPSSPSYPRHWDRPPMKATIPMAQSRLVQAHAWFAPLGQEVAHPCMFLYDTGEVTPKMFRCCTLRKFSALTKVQDLDIQVHAEASTVLWPLLADGPIFRPEITQGVLSADHILHRTVSAPARPQTHLQLPRPQLPG